MELIRVRMFRSHFFIRRSVKPLFWTDPATINNNATVCTPSLANPLNASSIVKISVRSNITNTEKKTISSRINSSISTANIASSKHKTNIISGDITYRNSLWYVSISFHSPAFPRSERQQLPVVKILLADAFHYEAVHALLYHLNGHGFPC